MKELKGYIDDAMKDCPLSVEQEEALITALEKYIGIELQDTKITQQEKDFFRHYSDICSTIAIKRNITEEMIQEICFEYTKRFA